MEDVLTANSLTLFQRKEASWSALDSPIFPLLWVIIIIAIIIIIARGVVDHAAMSLECPVLQGRSSQYDTMIMEYEVITNLHENN